MESNVEVFWSQPIEDLYEALESSPHGLSTEQVEERLASAQATRLGRKTGHSAIAIFLRQFKSPIVLLLLGAAVLAFFTQDNIDGAIIVVLLLISSFLGFWQEHRAAHTIEKLLSMISVTIEVLRDGAVRSVPLDDVVHGDVVVLSAGDLVPGDCRIIDSKDLFANEASLTGETYPAEKSAGRVDADSRLALRTNSLFMGTYVVSGAGMALLAKTGSNTEFGRISDRLKARPPMAEFERGVKRFGALLIQLILLLTLAIFAINVFLSRPVLDSFLFSLALAVGMTPELLPAIVSINLAHGAQEMARSKVIVKRLTAIEDFGSMNILCTDKTGTLTEGRMRIESAIDFDGNDSKKVLLFAYLNSSFESGYRNPIDEAILASVTIDVSQYSKVDEIPFDFIRKRLSILVTDGQSHYLVTKGAVTNVLDVCTRAESASGQIVPIDQVAETIRTKYRTLSEEGYRTLGVATVDMGASSIARKESEQDMVFLGFLVIADPPKAGMMDTLSELRSLGISLKVITGDNELVAAHIGREIGFAEARAVTGSSLRHMSDEALVRLAIDVDIFAEVEPNQKERIIMALQHGGNVVGYIGDGINDASALHTADVGISVDSAVDVAKEAADIVLLEKSLESLVQGVRDGRRTFVNTMKYIFITVSANFGNMFSMAAASLLLPFLPLLPKQILTLNVLSDMPAATIASDNVEAQLVAQPRRWNIRFITLFMVVFGIISTAFDFLTFFILLLVIGAGEVEFQTGWFIVSMVTELLVLLVLRDQGRLFSSRPSTYLSAATVIVLIITLLLPYSPLGVLFGLIPLGPLPMFLLSLVVVAYVVTTELAKRLFYMKVKR
ncbi:MAG: magnesium-translocating P-type ATPase [Candidatus Thorarchaeota archaeon]|nr:MAG: magnesium-translocating P-type ATPase [Candidatus Thorarchaeota archaeon]